MKRLVLVPMWTDLATKQVVFRVYDKTGLLGSMWLNTAIDIYGNGYFFDFLD